MNDLTGDETKTSWTRTVGVGALVGLLRVACAGVFLWLTRSVSGVGSTGEPLEGPMPEWSMSDQDLDDLVDFLKTLD